MQTPRDLEATQAVEVINRSGTVLSLPFDPAIDIARYVAHNQLLSQLRRFSLRPSVLRGEDTPFVEVPSILFSSILSPPSSCFLLVSARVWVFNRPCLLTRCPCAGLT